MAKPRRLEVGYTPLHYTIMAVLGAITIGLLIYFGMTFQGTTSDGQPMSPFMVWALLGLAGATMFVYARRGFTRMRDRRPVLVVDKSGIQLRMDKTWDIPWARIHRVGLGGAALRPRLEIQIDLDLHAEMRLPGLFHDDNFSSVRNKPSTVGIGWQGLNPPLRQVLECVRDWRPNLIKR